MSEIIIFLAGITIFQTITIILLIGIHFRTRFLVDAVFMVIEEWIKYEKKRLKKKEKKK